MIHFGKEEVLTALWDISTKQLSYRFTAILELPENLKTNWIYHNKKGESLKLSPFCTQTRGRTGMEVNPLVFETSASTDSAIWAFRIRGLFLECGCKGTTFFYTSKLFLTFSSKKVIITSFITNIHAKTKINPNLAETLKT